MPNFPQSPFGTLIFHKSRVITPVALSAQSFSLKAQIFTQDLISTLSSFGTYFLYEPCFHLNSPIFTKVSLSHTHFSPKPHFLPKMPNFPQKGDYSFPKEALFLLRQPLECFNLFSVWRRRQSRSNPSIHDPANKYNRTLHCIVSYCFGSYPILVMGVVPSLMGNVCVYVCM